MSVHFKAKIMLWGRAGGRCAFPECRKNLFYDQSQIDDATLIGDVCHIIAKEEDGPRGDYQPAIENRDVYSNLILLCKNHHKVVDDDTNQFTVEKLHAMKGTHERWVAESLEGYDVGKQRDHETYAFYITQWEDELRLDNWQDWASLVLEGGSHGLSGESVQSIRKVCEWLYSRIWPKRYLPLEASFENFRRVLNDFQAVFHEHAKDRNGNGEIYDTDRFYKISEWNKERYDKLFNEYEYHVALVEDLMLELTRAANYVCDHIRQFIDPSYRLEQGLVTLVSGPYMDLRYRRHRPEYREAERSGQPYPGLEGFRKLRESRDVNFGIGMDATEAKRREDEEK